MSVPRVPLIVRLAGHVDVEVHPGLKASREEVVAAAEQAIGGRPAWATRTRVTNLMYGQWSVRFYR